MRARVAVFLLILASLILEPIASAEHTYVHRLLVQGRVVDARDQPVANALVQLSFMNVQPQGDCPQETVRGEAQEIVPSTNTTTDDAGDFRFCVHADTLPDDATPVGLVAFPAQHLRQAFNIDAATRHAFVAVKFDRYNATRPPPILERTYTVRGVLWNVTPMRDIEGVSSRGDVVTHANVTITLASPSGNQTVQAQTNDQGDFEARFDVNQRVRSGTILISSPLGNATRPVDPDFAMTYYSPHKIEPPKQETPFPGLAVLVLTTAALAVARSPRSGRQP